jgi:eukaryotic-like serine/threonine-protein kinase
MPTQRVRFPRRTTKNEFMVISSSGLLMDSLRQFQLLTAEQLAQLPQLTHGRCGDARHLAKTLIQKDWLSVYQVNQLLAGNGKELVIGPYHVLDKLGQGGLSQVLKARHREHHSLVAIKMIRPEVFASTAGRTQFLQEVEAMARLDHANVVQFCDADQHDDTYYFAMEYVEGTDLGKVVRLSGALLVHEACDYVRQSALGLQHAYERNLIHRDIKPVNLFLTYQCETKPSRDACAAPAGRTPRPTMQAKPLIKILDWGLASLRGPNGLPGDQAGDLIERNVVGTADYLSPEQARNANAVDIRSDIYSLGCTFYYLLTGQAPFPDGSLMQKILAHQQAEPRPIGDFRTDVPAGVTAIVERMMAKQPEERFQTPASAALSLLSFIRQAPSVASSGSMPTLRGSLARPNRDDTPLPPALAGRPQQHFERAPQSGVPRGRDPIDAANSK